MILETKSNDFLTLKNNVMDYIKSLSNYKEVMNDMDTSLLDLVASLVAGYANFTNYKFTMNKEETFLQSAKLNSSIYQIAFALGYRFQRAKSPEITLKYFGKEDIVLNPGDVIGEYVSDNGKYEIVYFNYSKKLKPNDYFNASIGKFNHYEITNLSNSFNSFEIKPQFLKCVDNDKIFVETELGLFRLSTMFEDFILNKKIVNWSKSPYEMMLYVNDKENNFGDLDIQDLKLIYLETDGEIKNFSVDNVKLTGNFLFSDLYFNGLDEDSPEKIKTIAPNLRNTKARAVTKNDYYYYIMNTNFFEDVYVEPEKNIPANWKLEFEEPDDFEATDKLYALEIEGSYIELTKYSYESMDEFKIRFKSMLENSLLVSPMIVKSEDGQSFELYLEQKYLDREITIKGTAIDVVKLNDFEKAQSCVLNIFYVKKGQELLRPPLTTSELLYLDNYMKNYSIVGIKLVYIPAVPKVTNLSLSVKLYDNKFQKDVYEHIKKVIDKYQYKLNTSFEIDKIISEIVKFKIYINGVEIHPVISVKNLIDDSIVNTSSYEYIVFYGIDIVFED